MSELIVLGFGSMISHLISQEDFDSRHKVIVTNQSGTTFPKIRNSEFLSYKEFLNKGVQHNSLLVVGTRLDKLSEITTAKFLSFLESRNFRRIARRDILVLSSAAVYGNSNLPATEARATNAVNNYGQGKVDLEKYFLETSNLESPTILRIGNVYAFPGSNDFVEIVKRAILGKSEIAIPPKVCTRDFVNINDLAAFFRDWTSDKSLRSHGIINFCTGESLELSEVLKIATAASGLELVIRNTHSEPEISISNLSATKLKSIWGRKLAHPRPGIRDYLIKV